jgi:hypothetical protein
VPVVDAEQRIRRLAVVGEIDLRETGTTLTNDVESDDRMTGVTQPGDDGSSELSGCSSYSNTHFGVPYLIEYLKFATPIFAAPIELA